MSTAAHREAYQRGFANGATLLRPSEAYRHARTVSAAIHKHIEQAQNTEPIGEVYRQGFFQGKSGRSRLATYLSFKTPKQKKIFLGYLMPEDKYNKQFAPSATSYRAGQVWIVEPLALFNKRLSVVAFLLLKFIFYYP